MRALLLANPRATGMSPRVRDVIVGALSSELALDVVMTRERGHAGELAAAARDRADVVVALGGDGTVNEVANGLLGDGPRPDLPALAVVPTGSANVFARSLGLPRDPVEATAELLRALRGGRRRRIGLGRADERWFTFCAGLGLDAEVIREVERARDGGQRASPALYVALALRQFFLGTDRRHPALRLESDGRPPVDDLFLAIVANTSPWTYLGSVPVQPIPEAAFDRGLDLLALRRLGTIAMLGLIRRMLSPTARPPRGRHVTRLHDASGFDLVATRPVALQLDGDYLGERDRVRFRAARDALQVIPGPTAGRRDV